MFAWTVWCGCFILHVSLQGGQAEGIRGNDLLYDYDNDWDVWTERSSTTDVPTDIPRTGIYTPDKSSQPGTDVRADKTSPGSITTESWTDDDSNGSDNNVTRPETVYPTDNNMTRPETVSPTDNNVTRPETYVTVDLRTKSSKTTASTGERPIGTSTSRFPYTAPPDVCRNSSCPDILSLTTTVPEGGNVTLRCGTASGERTLWWYRDATLLQRGVGEVFLHISDADQSYSAPYLCVDERGCCILEHRVSVYEVPKYAYHLAVMGAVLALGIPLCIYLSVRQSTRLGQYARMFNERHGEAKLLIL